MTKVLSLLLAAVLLCGLCGVSALAEGEALPEGVPRDELEVCYRREVKAGQSLRVEYGVRDGKHDVFIRAEDGTLHAWIELKGR